MFFKFRFVLEYVCTKRQIPLKILALLCRVAKYTTIDIGKKKVS